MPTVHPRVSVLSLSIRYAVIIYMLALIGIPLLALLVHGLSNGIGGMWQALRDPQAMDAVLLTLWSSLVIALFNGVFGTATAWVLTRYQFKGRRALATLIDLPLAIPTLVAGVMLVVLLGPTSSLGIWCEARDIHLAFNSPIILLALGFVTLPFTVRAVQPVLQEMDLAEEEAAATLGANRFTTFTMIIWPAIFPAVTSGVLQSFARAMAEFGSVVVVSGNIPYETLTAPVYIFGQVESGDSTGAAAVATALVALSLVLTIAARRVEKLGERGHE